MQLGHMLSMTFTYTGAYPEFTIRVNFLAVAREAHAKNLATVPTFRPRPLINDHRFYQMMATICLILDDFSRKSTRGGDLG